MADSQQAHPKIKTKGKKRYLKAKKERRKQRKNSAHRSGALTEEGSSDNPEDAPREKTPTVIDLTESAGAAVEADSQKRKKRKLDHLTPVGSLEHQRPQLVEVDESKFVEEPTELALQGLDKAQVEAELIDPNSTLHINLDIDDNELALSLKTQKRLIDLGINNLFAVQTVVIPFLLRYGNRYTSLYDPYHPPRDVCVSAPTGSGKTLAYALPIIELLSSRIVTRLRALIVLPTRDLVAQVREVFEMVGKGRGLKIGTVTGQHSFSHEQTQLVTDEEWRTGRTSKVDVLICTPGRLIDHIDGTPLFTLRDLRFLVIDEADKLLNQSFQDWLAKVLAVIHRPYDSYIPRPLKHPPSGSEAAGLDVPQVPHHQFKTDFDEPKHSSCQKLLFSATLTSDPGKIASLGLRDPKYFVVRETTAGAMGTHPVISGGFSMPTNLVERMIVCNPSQKPLILFYLVNVQEVDNALVFTKSAESTTRLVKLFELFEDSSPMTRNQRLIIRAYSSDLPPPERKSILEQFKEKKISVLVCSDLISRGLDISHVTHVISYDTPIDIRKYVHRVGRTARAGRHGEAWTLVEEQEARHFKAMMKDADHFDQIRRLRVSDKDLAPFATAYDTALAQLKASYQPHL